MYPIITDIEQVREAIRGRPEFIEADKGDYIVFNYMVAHHDSFDCPIRRECRGLIFSKDGKILARRYHKFFNYGEKEITHPSKVDFTKPHVVQVKEDGSMISPIMLNGRVRWTTKMGLTDIAAEVEKFVETNPGYEKLAKICIKWNLTPIFEYVSPTNRIVLEYSKPLLILLDIRDNVNGFYFSYDAVKEIAHDCLLPVVDKYLFSDIYNLKEQIGIEGAVVKFLDYYPVASEQFIKIKTDWYCDIHSAKENLLYEKNVIKLILEEKLDDILPNLLEVDQQRLLSYASDLLLCVDKYVHYIMFVREQYGGYDRKQFALEIAPKLPKFDLSVIYASWDDVSRIRQTVVRLILKHTKSQVDIEKIRDIIPVKWTSTGV